VSSAGGTLGMLVVSSPTRFLIASTSTHTVRTAIFCGAVGLLLAVLQAWWPRYSLACIRHPVDAPHSLLARDLVRVYEDVDCQFSRISWFDVTGAFSLQWLSTSIELQNVTIVHTGPMYNVELDDGQEFIVLQSFGSLREAQALEGSVREFLLATQRPDLANRLLRVTVGQDSSWVVALVGYSLLCLFVLLLTCARAREFLELSATSGTATVGSHAAIPLFRSPLRSFPLERFVRVVVVSAGSRDEWAMECQLHDSISGRTESFLFGPHRRGQRPSDMDASASLRIVEKAPSCSRELAWACWDTSVHGPGGNLEAAAAAANRWLLTYAETGVGAETAAPVIPSALRERRLSEASSDREPLVPASPAGETSRVHPSTCVICRDLPPNTALEPCRHLCLCSHCGKSFSAGRLRRCPVCRVEIVSLLKLQLV
jgi:hypothetical protein